MGKWKTAIIMNGELNYYYRCSCCGQKIGGDTNCAPHFHFCPNCGEPMTEKALEILHKRQERGEAE